MGGVIPGLAGVRGGGEVTAEGYAIRFPDPDTRIYTSGSLTPIPVYIWFPDPDTRI